MDYLLPYGLEWANLLVRWLHIITGIAWIGASLPSVSAATGAQCISVPAAWLRAGRA